MANPTGRFAVRLALLVAVATGVPQGVRAQSDTEASDARGSAEAAAQAAREAQAELEAARRQLEAAERRAREKARAAAEAQAAAADAEEAAAQAPAPASPQQAPPDRSRAEAVAEEARKRAIEAESRARAADVRARRALEKVEALERRLAYDRTGLYFGGSVFYAPEDLDIDGDLRADNTVGASGRVGYRLHSHFAFEARFDYLDRLEIEGELLDPVGAGTRPVEFDLDAYSVTGNLRVFLLPWRVQPWLGIGAGAIWTDLEGRDTDTGERLETRGRETDALFRVSGGVDFYLTSHFVLNLEAAYNTVGGDRDFVRYGMLGAGLDFRF